MWRFLGRHSVRLMDGEYFRSKVSINSLDESGCWAWNGFKMPNGYGQACRNGRRYYAHRFSYELFIGPIPRDLVIDHLCNTRECVNPTHLAAVTQAQNVLRSATSLWAINARKTHCPKGHEYSAANTYLHKGGRHCKVCMDIRDVGRKRSGKIVR